MKDVFISYSRKDISFVRQLFEALEQQQHESWVDWKGIDYSTSWWDEICAGIDSAHNFVFIISPDSLDSKYCHDEIAHARKQNKRIIPFIWPQYHESAPVSNLDPDSAAAAAGVRDAVVLVADGWGSRLISRMWALGVPVKRSSRLYMAIDACTLDLALEDARRDPARRARIERTLDSLAAIGRRGVETNVTDDPHLRLPAEAVASGRLPAKCVEEIRLDRPGFLNYPRFLWLNEVGLDGDIVWARDQGRWNEDLVRRYPGRRFYRYAPVVAGGAPVFTPLDRHALVSADE